MYIKLCHKNRDFSVAYPESCETSEMLKTGKNFRKTLHLSFQTITA